MSRTFPRMTVENISLSRTIIGKRASPNAHQDTFGK